MSRSVFFPCFGILFPNQALLDVVEDVFSSQLILNAALLSSVGTVPSKGCRVEHNSGENLTEPTQQEVTD